MEDAKQNENIENLNVLATLTPSQYWEWRCTIEELTTAKQEAKIAQQKTRILELEIELGRTRHALFQSSVKEALDKAKRVEADYQVFREKLEKEIGCTLKDCVIDEFNYTVKKL